MFGPDEKDEENRSEKDSLKNVHRKIYISYLNVFRPICS
jgi:hypothetical protein